MPVLYRGITVPKCQRSVVKSLPFFLPRIHTSLIHKTQRLKRRIFCVEPCGRGQTRVDASFEALSYKPEVRGFYSRWGCCYFSFN